MRLIVISCYYYLIMFSFASLCSNSRTFFFFMCHLWSFDSKVLITRPLCKTLVDVGISASWFEEE